MTAADTALLATAREIAAGLTKPQRAWLPREGHHRDCTSNIPATLRALQRRGLGMLRFAGNLGRPDLSWRLTDLGRAVARVLAEGTVGK